MGAKDTRQEFERIVARLTTDYPSLARATGSRWPRPVLITVLSVGAVVWALLSMSMVAWGWKGVVLTCAVAGIVLTVAAVDEWRRRRY